MRADYLGFVTTLQQRHGDLTRMRLVYEDAWDLMSPDLVREALVTHADRLIRWERGISVFAQVFGQSVLVTEGATWQRQRRMLMPAFSPKRVAGYAALMTLPDAKPAADLAEDVAEQVEIQVKYQGYIDRQAEEVAKAATLESTPSV